MNISFLNQLGQKIKDRRAVLSRSDVGLSEFEYKLGLTQQEVAVLSGVSTRWLAQLEQGILKSGHLEYLSSVLQVLNFPPEEQHQMLRMAGWVPENLNELTQQAQQAHLQQLLDGINHPAYVVDFLWERVCWNKAAAKLFTHWLGERTHYTNFLDYMLLDPQSRLFFQNWEQISPLWIHRFFNDIRPYRSNPKVQQFIDSHIQRSPTFAQHGEFALPHANLPMGYTLHTAKGFKPYNRMAFPIDSAPYWRLVVWLPERDKS